MAKIALIQNQYLTLNTSRPETLSEFAQDVRRKFFEVLVEESGHSIHQGTNLSDFQSQDHPMPDLIICAPFPESGNLAPALLDLAAMRDAFPEVPIIVWSERGEASLGQTVVDDYGAVAYYQGTLLDAPDDFADMVLKYT